MTFGTNYKTFAVTEDGMGLSLQIALDSTVLTREELEKLAGEIWDASERYERSTKHPDKQQYISSLLNR